MRSILKDVSVDEMLNMRESGMTNMDIAKALGISYPSVYRYIGAQPSRSGVVSAHIEPKDRFKAVENAPEEVYEAVLPVVNRIITLTGIIGEYAVDVKGKKVRCTINSQSVELDFDEWQEFAKEVAAISRNLDKQHVAPEVW